MQHVFEAVRISERVYWVGAIDWELRDFHGYQTSRGSTYNAYLVLADKLTLIDTVKAPFLDEMLARIASLVDPAEIRCVVSNHAELDHSGGLPLLLQRVHPETVVASVKGVRTLHEHFHWDRVLQEVRTGSQLDLGNARLRFVETPMLHWPESMFSYLEEEQILFSQDAFGMHLASVERFADEADPAVLRQEAAKYFANILLPFSNAVTALLGKLPELAIAPHVIAPDHGPIWRESPPEIVAWYGEWAAQRPARKAVVVYDTMWQSTARMAHAVAEGLTAGGVTARLMPLEGSHRSDVVTELLEAGGLIVGSPTLNNQILPRLADVMTYLKGLRPRNLVGAAFGSYGWSGESVARLEELLRDMHVELAEEGVRVLYVPDAEGLGRCRSLGAAVAARLGEKISREG